jgi:hypothetical protein
MHPVRIVMVSRLPKRTSKAARRRVTVLMARFEQRLAKLLKRIPGSGKEAGVQILFSTSRKPGTCAAFVNDPNLKLPGAR